MKFCCSEVDDNQKRKVPQEATDSNEVSPGVDKAGTTEEADSNDVRKTKEGSCRGRMQGIEQCMKVDN